MQKIFKIFSIYRGKLYILILISLITAILEAIGLAALAPVLSIITSGDGSITNFLPDYVIENKSRLIGFLAISISIIFISKNLIIIILKYFSNKIVFSIKSNLEARLFGSYLNTSFDSAILKNSAHASSQIMTEVQIFTFNVMQALVVLSSELFIILILLIYLITYDPSIFIIIICPLVLILIPIHKYSSFKQRQWGEENRKANERLYAILEVGIGGMKEIRIFGGFNYFFKLFSKNANNVARTFANSNTLAMMPLPFLETLLIVVLFSSLYYLIDVKDLSVNKITEMIGLYGLVAIRLLPSISRLVTSINQIKFGFRSVNSISESLKQNVTSVEQKFITPPLDFSRLNLLNVSFKYSSDNSEQLVFDNINLEILKGQLLGICGESGSGKSTLVGLILGLMKPNSGVILLNGNVVDDSAIATYHQIIGYVPQDVYIVDGSLSENIAFGVSSDLINHKVVLDLCIKVGLQTLIEGKKPEEIRLVGRGGNISGGQRARIGLARALYRRPQILILDEVTAGLDKVTAEFILHEIIYKRSLDLTVIMISHQMANFKGFDKVYAVKNNCIERNFL
jgi:ATP-binding cassette, subfamily B, bacterial PglK